MPVAGPPVERPESHPQNPTAKWAKFQRDIRDHAIRTEEARARRDEQKQDATEYARREAGLPQKGQP